MKSGLEEMTLEELWQLFPIILSPYNPDWGLWAKEEIGFLSDILTDFNPTISHIGSSAIPGIQAKPIVDILVETDPGADWEAINSIMISNGYICMAEAPGRLSFNKGYTPEGYDVRVFHIHFHLRGDNDEIIFRDYLLSHPEVAKEYERLKQKLASEFRNNRDAYTEAKSGFIKKTLQLSAVGL